MEKTFKRDVPSCPRFLVASLPLNHMNQFNRSYYYQGDANSCRFPARVGSGPSCDGRGPFQKIGCTLGSKMICTDEEAALIGAGSVCGVFRELIVSSVEFYRGVGKSMAYFRGRYRRKLQTTRLFYK